MAAASGKGDLRSVSLMVENGSEVTGEAIISAVIECHADIVRYLIDKGNDLTYVDDHGQTILDYAYDDGDTITNAPEENREKYKKAQKEIIKMLEAAGAKRGNAVE